MDKLNHTLNQLHTLANTKSLHGMARFGIDTNGQIVKSVSNQFSKLTAISLFFQKKYCIKYLT